MCNSGERERECIVVRGIRCSAGARITGVHMVKWEDSHGHYTGHLAVVDDCLVLLSEIWTWPSVV